MTKFFGIPGLRLGYAISSSSLAERLDAIGGPWRVNTLALVAGTAALKDADYIRRTVEETSLERLILSRLLEQFPHLRVYPSSVNYLLVEIMNDTSAAAIQEYMLQQRILIRNCASFVGLSERFFRVAVKSRADNQSLIDALEMVFSS
jgi:threonine-phosphate decarboxylase